MIELRGWQREAKACVQSAWAEGIACPTVVAPTGSGKTALAAALIEEWDGPVLFTAHRDVLIDQTKRAMQSFLPGHPIGIVRADDNETDRRITVASLQTLASRDRLDDYLAVNPPTLVIADEAHMSVAEGFKRTFATLGLVDRAVTALGLSATLARTQGESLAELWDAPVFSMSLGEAIDQGILVPPRGVRIKVEDTVLLSAAKNAAAWAEGDSAVEQTDAPQIIADAIIEHCAGRAIIGFAATVRSAMVMARACQAKGLTSQVITAHTPADMRQAVFDDSKEGRCDVIWSVDTLSVGADLPWVSGIVLARNTSSRIWFVQAVGRGLRTYPGKTDCVVLEATSNSTRMELDTFFDIEGWTSNSERPPSSAIVDQDLEDIAVAATVEIGRPEYESFDFFVRPSLWLTTLGGLRFLPAYNQTIFLVPDGHGTFSVGSTPGRLWYEGRATRHGRNLSLEDATLLAEAHARMCDQGAPVMYGRRMGISTRSASWRNRSEPASGGQINMLGLISTPLLQSVCTHIGIRQDQLDRQAASAVISIAVASAIASRLGFDPPLNFRRSA